MRPHTLGTGYVNFQMQEEGDRVRKMYGATTTGWPRSRRRYDPDNTFAVNQNIKPAA